MECDHMLDDVPGVPGLAGGRAIPLSVACPNCVRGSNMKRPAAEAFVSNELFHRLAAQPAQLPRRFT